jgi:hypothetical protein
VAVADGTETPDDGHDVGRDGHGDRPGHPTHADLRAHLDDRLAPQRAAEVDRHLDACVACGEELERLEPALPLGGPTATPPPSDEDERWMRRAVRRTVVHTAGWAAVLLLVAVILFQLAAELLWHPLAVDRGERVDDAVTASIDLPVVTIPGAQLEQYISNVDGFRRTTEVDVTRPVGARVAPLGSYETTLGPWAARPREPLGWGPRLSDARLSNPTGWGPGLADTGSDELAEGPFDPDRLEGLAVAVLHVLDGSIDDDGVVAELPIDGEVALTWVGFDPGPRDGTPNGELLDSEVPDREVPPLPLGYSACTDPTADVGRLTGSSGFGSGGTFRVDVPGIEHARAEFRRAATTITASGLAEGAHEALGEALRAVATGGSDLPLPIDSIVLTGSAGAVDEVLSQGPAGTSYLLAVDFDTGPPGPCG